MLDVALQRGNVDLRAQRGLGNGDGNLTVQIVAVTLKNSMGAHRDLNDEIACRPTHLALTALTAQRNALTAVNAGRDGDGQLASLALQSRATAFLTGGLDVLAGAAALFAGGLGLEGHASHPLNRYTLTRATAIRAGLSRGACLSTAAGAGGALVQAVVVHILLATKGRLLEGQRDAGQHVVAPLRAGTTRRTAAERTAEDAAENIAKVAEITKAAAEAATAVSAGRGVKGRVTKLVVLRLLLGIREDGVSLVDLLEVLFRLGITGVEVRVIFLGQLAIGALDGVRIGGLVKAQYLVIVSLCHV